MARLSWGTDRSASRPRHQEVEAFPCRPQARCVPGQRRKALSSFRHRLGRLCGIALKISRLTISLAEIGVISAFPRRPLFHGTYQLTHRLIV